ncbi:MAG: hypothetical protein ACKOBN_01715 [Flavobacteriales bacterium]
MTRQEALALHNLTDNEDLAEQLEFLFFEFKKKIYQQLDQVLLYPKWISALKSLSKAAEVLQLPFEQQQAIASNDAHFDVKQTLVDQFNRLKQLKVNVARLLYNSPNPQNVLELLEFYRGVLSKSFAYWSKAIDFQTEVRLSRQFDPILILSDLKLMEQAGICYLHELQQQNTATLIKEWISWNKALVAKLKEH